MAATLPYLSTPGTLKTALERIRAAATPDRITKDFVSTKLQMKGGSGAAIIPYLKKIGFVASDGSPTALYKQFRNTSTGAFAVAASVKEGYKPLLEINEYFYELNDKDLFNLILQVTGADANSQVAKLTLSTLKTLKSFAKFDGAPPQVEDNMSDSGPVASSSLPAFPTIEKRDGRRQLGLNLAYTINLNLPTTADQAVFNAIFRSLKEHLIPDE